MTENLKHSYLNNTQSYNEPFTMGELKDAIHDTTDTSPGNDKVTYSMFNLVRNLSVLYCYSTTECGSYNSYPPNGNTQS